MSLEKKWIVTRAKHNPTPRLMLQAMRKAPDSANAGFFFLR
jgi:hypothetical protein